jgi:hypothetical protein
MKPAILFPLVCFILSCNKVDKVPAGIIKQNTMQELIWDMLRADAFVTSFTGKNDSSFNKLSKSISYYRQIFAIHKTNKEEFKKSLNWYQQHPKLMKIMLDTLQNRRNRVMQQRSRPIGIPPADSLKI